MRTVSVGMLGLGNVGAGVVRLLADNQAAIERRLGARLEVRRIAVQSPDKPRRADVDPRLLTTRAEEVIDDSAVQIVCELIGGEHPAREYILRAIERGLPVVTANKALLATRGDEIFAAAERRGVDVSYEASVCGGIPIIRALREGLASDRIERLMGIVNGTSNFILSAMADEGVTFEAALARAQAEGYAEADPSLDVDGVDAAHKLAILASLSFGMPVPLERIYVEGIRGLSPVDFEYARRFGYVIKSLAIAASDPAGRVQLRVHPTMIPQRWLLALVEGVHNAVYVSSYALGNSMYYGRGAGMMPTAVAVVSDLLEVARDLVARGNDPPLPPRSIGTRSFGQAAHEIATIDELVGRYYLRFTVVDRPGVLAQIAAALGEHEVSMAQVHQEADRGRDWAATLVVLTHTAKERAVCAALDHVASLPVVVEPTRIVRIAE